MVNLKGAWFIKCSEVIDVLNLNERKFLERKWSQINGNFFCLRGILDKGLLESPGSTVNWISHENLRLCGNCLRI